MLLKCVTFCCSNMELHEGQVAKFGGRCHSDCHYQNWMTTYLYSREKMTPLNIKKLNGKRTGPSYGANTIMSIVEPREWTCRDLLCNFFNFFWKISFQTPGKSFSHSSHYVRVKPKVVALVCQPCLNTLVSAMDISGANSITSVL